MTSEDHNYIEDMNTIVHNLVQENINDGYMPTRHAITMEMPYV